MEFQDPVAQMRSINEKYRYASTYGLYLGLYMGAFYLLSALMKDSTLIQVLCSIGNLGALVLAWYYIRKYRDEVLGGYSKFGWIWSFAFWLSVFAALIMAAIHFIHFQWIQPNFIAETFNQALNMLEEMKYPEEQLNALVDFGVPSAIQLTFMYLWLEIIGGALLAIIYGLILQRRDAFGECPVPNQSQAPTDEQSDDTDGEPSDKQNE